MIRVNKLECLPMGGLFSLVKNERALQKGGSWPYLQLLDKARDKHSSLYVSAKKQQYFITLNPFSLK